MADWLFDNLPYLAVALVIPYYLGFILYGFCRAAWQDYQNYRQWRKEFQANALENAKILGFKIGATEVKVKMPKFSFWKYINTNNLS